jgi:PPOX class probable F420-dependent enzyme
MRMPSRRAQITMTPEEVDAFLAGRRTMNVATIGPTGHPHVVAMWYGFYVGAPAFWTFGRSQKILNLRRDPKLSALVEDGEDYAELKGVELVGTGRIVEDRDATVAIGLSVATRYQNIDEEAARRFVESQADKRIAVVIDVERTVTWDHGKLGGMY